MARKTLVLVTGLSLAACTGKASEPRPELRNPPAWPHRAPPAEKIERAPATGVYPVALNVRDDQRGLIYASGDGGCHVYRDDGVQRPPGMMGPTVRIKCPDAMLAPEWGHCTSALMASTDDGATCACLVSGNPPPPAFLVPCPKQL